MTGRRGVTLPIDREKVAEEIGSLGRSDRRGIVSRPERIAAGWHQRGA